MENDDEIINELAKHYLGYIGDGDPLLPRLVLIPEDEPYLTEDTFDQYWFLHQLDAWNLNAPVTWHEDPSEDTFDPQITNEIAEWERYVTDEFGSTTIRTS